MTLFFIHFQVNYVLQIARALASMTDVNRVDLLDSSYGEQTEMISPLNFDDMMQEIRESSGAYRIHITFGQKTILLYLNLKHIVSFG